MEFLYFQRVSEILFRSKLYLVRYLSALKSGETSKSSLNTTETCRNGYINLTFHLAWIISAIYNVKELFYMENMAITQIVPTDRWYESQIEKGNSFDTDPTDNDVLNHFDHLKEPLLSDDVYDVENSSDFEDWNRDDDLSEIIDLNTDTFNGVCIREHQVNSDLPKEAISNHSIIHERDTSQCLKIKDGNHVDTCDKIAVLKQTRLGKEDEKWTAHPTIDMESCHRYMYHVKDEINSVGNLRESRREDDIFDPEVGEEQQEHVESLTAFLPDETTDIRSLVPKKLVCITDKYNLQRLLAHSKNPDYSSAKNSWLQPMSEEDGSSEKPVTMKHDNEDISLIKTTLDSCLTFQYQPRICKNFNVYLCQGTIGVFDAMHLKTKTTGDVEELHRNFKYEWIRYRSFEKYSTKFNMYPSVLAREGWWYSDGTEGMTDKVTCFECRKSHQDWNRGEDARQHHADSCRFLRGTSSNIPINNRNSSMTQAAFAPTSTNNSRSAISQTASGGESDLFPSQESLTLPAPVQQTEDNPQVEASASQTSDRLCNNGNTGNSKDSRGTVQAQSEDTNTSRNQLETPGRSNEATNSHTAASSSENNRSQRLASSVETNVPRPKYPAYELMETRTKSFQGWPTGKTQTPRELALAGLFFAGYEDYVRCHSCGIGLRNWDDGDDPWVEHARWSPNCDYVIRSRGKKFVDLIQRKAQEKESERSESAGNRQAKANSALEKEMQSETVKSIRDMGYSDDAITSALTTLKRRLGPGKHKVTAQDVLDIILEQSQEDTTGGNVHSASAATSTSVGEHTKFDKTESVSKQSKPSSPEYGNRTMQDDHRDLTEQLTCKICMERSVAMTFIPCGHLACCEECSRKIMRCPICRTRIKSKYKTYFT